MSMKLRDYQEKGISQLRSKFKEGKKRVIFFLATGGGKGACISWLIDSCIKNNTRVLVLVRRRSLIVQIVQIVKMYHNNIAGIIMGTTPMNLSHLCQVASIDTFHRRIDKLKNDFKFIIIDECHDTSSPSYKRALEWLGDKQYVGFTATPFNENPFWEDYVKPIEMHELRDQGSLSDAKVYSPPTIDVSEVRKQAGDFNNQDLFDKTTKSKVIGDVVEHYIKYGLDKPAILFAVNKAHSKIMAAAFNNSGIPATHCDDEHTVEERSIAIRNLESGKIKVLCNCNIFSTGVDIPVAQVGIMVRPTMSEILYVQQIGRLLRPHKNKDYAIILDHAGNTHRHGMPFEVRDAVIGADDKNKNKNKNNIGKLRTYTCKECFYISATNFIQCPMCDHERKLTDRVIDHEDGELIEITKIDPIKRYYDKLLKLEKEKGYKPFAKFFKLYERFGDESIHMIHKSVPMLWRKSCPAKKKCPINSVIIINGIYKCNACGTKYTANNNTKEIINDEASSTGRFSI